MPTFYYIALEPSGKEVQGIIDAQTKKNAIAELQQKNYIPVELNEEKSTTTSGSPLDRIFGGVKKSVLVETIRQLSTLIDSGISLYRALSLVEEQCTNKKLRSALEDIRNLVKEGVSFSDALSSHEEIFPKLFTNMVKAGEKGGVLEKVVDKFASYAEKEESLKSRIVTMMAYPTLLSIVGLVTIIFVLTFVLPKFVIIFEDLSQSLPAPTMILIALSSIMSKFWWLLIILIVGIIVVVQIYIKTEDGKLMYDKLKLKIPIAGSLINKILISRFSLMLGTLLSSSVPILDSLKLTKDTIDNKVISSALDKVYESVEHGRGLTEPLKESNVFPNIVIQMIAVGEETGKLGQMLFKVAESYDMQIENDIKRLISLLEPMMIVVMGAFVGFIVVAMLLPIFEMNFIFE